MVATATWAAITFVELGQEQDSSIQNIREQRGYTYAKYVACAIQEITESSLRLDTSIVYWLGIV
jgi:hypothetical protein